MRKMNKFHRRYLSPWNLIVLLLLGLMSQGCLYRGYGGYAYSDQHHAVQVSAHMNALVLGAAARAKIGPGITEVAIAGEVGLGTPEGDQFFYTYVGVNALNLGVIDQKFRLGVGSPWAQAGWGICEEYAGRSGVCYTIGVEAEAVVRFGPAEVEPFFGVVFGINEYEIPKLGK